MEELESIFVETGTARRHPPVPELKRCNMARGCHVCLKYMMFIFNLIFWLGGCGILGIGIWLSVTQGNFATLSPSFPSLSAANILISTGTIMMVVGFIGCLGAIKEHKCLLLSFFVCLLIIFVLEMICVILFFMYRDQIDGHAKDDLKEGLRLYGSEGNVGLTNAWNIVQTDFHCCGVVNHTDWFLAFGDKRVPDSCCMEYSVDCGRDKPNTWWPSGCYDKVEAWIEENLMVLGVFILCISLIQILGMAFSMSMFCQLYRQKKNHYV
ncbi:tetraspanin-4-like isoform X2 [Lethenteron reissneri]|uniref:tetraspanin-4-like isoform X2 n=1 Tax=Lethenteron reissneri TaxID=7753 RepID=UPI002AB6670A|nr:tetraspanin-4-like isoform X2 [Lethenteron reissneri]